MQIDEITRLKKLAGIHMDKEGSRVDVMMRVTSVKQVLKKDNICESIKLYQVLLNGLSCGLQSQN